MSLEPEPVPPRAANNTLSASDTCIYFRQKKAPTCVEAFPTDKILAMSYSHMGTPTLPSAILHFTAEFEMGSGGAIALFSPENWLLKSKVQILCLRLTFGNMNHQSFDCCLWVLDIL